MQYAGYTAHHGNNKVTQGAKMPKPTDSYTAKLAESGITPTLAKRLGYRHLTPAETAKLGHKAVESLKIPYYTLGGNQTKFYRVRYLATTKKGFATQTSAKAQRYDQPTGAQTELYIPPLLDWSKYLATGNPLFITEGEFKAACATARGYPTIALGGVWNFCSRKKGVQLLPIFDELRLEGRDVYIVYDSDSVTNPQVVAAENELCRQITNKKCAPKVVRLPNIGDNKKTGLDDYLLSEEADKFEALLAQAQPYKYAKDLLELNEEVIYVENPSLVIRRNDGYKMGVSTFKNEVFAHRNFLDLQGEKPKKVQTATEWIKWAGRAAVNTFAYKPGEPEFILARGKAAVNMWKPFDVEAKEGDVTPWHTLLAYMFKGEDDNRKWFEQWLAYPLQHLGVKLFTAAVVWSVKHGTGKTLIGHTMQRIYGDNSIMIGNKDLANGNNSFAENKQFILGEEIKGDERRGLAEQLRSLITNAEIRINIKYVPEYSTLSCANYYFTSNNPDAFFLDEEDRRLFIHEVIGAPLEESWYTDVYDKWYKSAAGIAALYYHLLHLDVTGFSPTAKAPMTRAKQEMIESSRSVLANWVNSVREDPEQVLRVAGKPLGYKLYSVAELLKIFDPEDKGRVGIRSMAVELKRAMVGKAAQGTACRTVNGQCRLWAVKGGEEYLDAWPAVVGKAYDKEREGDIKAQKFTRQGVKERALKGVKK